MWIPTPVYERIPQFLIVVGLLFMSSSLYLSFDHSLAYVYLGTGIFCFVWGVSVVAMRMLYRKTREDQPQER